MLDLAPEQLVMVGNNVFRDVRGSCNAGFRHAFHIQREGALLSSNLGLARTVGNLPSGRTSITSMTELFWYLKGFEPCYSDNKYRQNRVDRAVIEANGTIGYRRAKLAKLASTVFFCLVSHSK